MGQKDCFFGECARNAKNAGSDFNAIPQFVLDVDSWLTARINHFDNGAVVAERRGAAELRYCGENVFHGPLLRRDFESLVVKEFAFSILGFGDAISNQHQPVSRMQAVAVALIRSVRKKADWQIAVRWANDLAATNQQRRNVPTIDVFQFSITTQPRNNHGGVLLANMFAGEKSVSRRNNLGQRSMRD